VVGTEGEAPSGGVSQQCGGSTISAFSHALREHFLAWQTLGRKLGQVAGLPPALAQRLASEPSDHPDHIYGRRRQELL
jgi:hypothetical protein